MTNIGGKYGNTNAIYGQAIYGDTTAPTLDLTSSSFSFDGFINSSPVSFTATFSEPVYNFTAADISITNGSITAASFSGSTGSSVYTFSVTPSSNGGVVVSIAGGDAYDGSGNAIPSDSYSFIYDTQRPSVTIDGYNGSVVGGVAQATTITLQATFSEPVLGFTASDILITGGTLQSETFTAVSTSVYRFDVYSLGTVKVNIAENTCTDRAGNNNIAAVEFDYVYDIVAPTVTISSTLISSGAFRQSSGPIPLTIAFSEAVTGFVVGDISITNGSLSNFSGSGSSYSVDAYASSEGLVSVSIASEVAQDSAGNLNEASNTFTFTYDITNPTVTISTTTVSSGNKTNVSPVVFSIAFSESVTGFTVADLTLSGGSASNFAGSGANYSFSFESDGEGEKSVSIAADKCQDSAGNQNLASNNYTFTYDVTRPSVALGTTTVSNEGYTSVTPIPFTVVFSEPVTGFTSGDISVSGGSVSSFSGSNANYSFNFVPSSQGAKSVAIAAEVCQDLAGNRNLASDSYSFVFDSQAPTVEITSTNGALANDGYTSLAGPFNFTITFSEIVTGFVSGDISVSGGSVSNFTAVSGSIYTFDFAISNQGSKSISIASNVAQDSAGNQNSASNTFAFVYDSVRPTTQLSTSSVLNDGYTRLSSIPFLVVFGESVTGFTSGDISVSGGSVSGFAGSGANYSFNFIPSGQGAKSVAIAAEVCQDNAGNQNLASDSYSFVFDNQAPTVYFAVAADGNSVSNDGYAKGSNIVLEVHFSEMVAGLSVGEIEVSNAVKGTLTSEDLVDGYASLYTLPLTPSNDGQITISMAAEVAYDRAGNLSEAPSEFRFTYDSTTPTITSFTSSDVADDGYANISSATFSISFSEPISGFSLTDVIASAGTKGQLTGSGQNYSFTLSSLPEGLVEVYVIQSAVIDSAGNTNISQSETYSFTVDRTRPVPVISSTTVNAGGSATSRFNSFTVDFGEAVSGFISSDIQATNGTLTNFVAASEGYSRTFTFDFEANLGAASSSLAIAENVASDRAGNLNFAATTFSFTNDILPPSVAFASSDVTNGGFTTANPVSIVATWSETPVGFTSSDITAISGTIVNFLATANSRVFTFDVNPESNSSMISFFVPANTVVDGIGNANLISETFTAYLIRRTKVGQTDQFLSSLGYDDQLNQASAEQQSGAVITEEIAAVAATMSGFKVTGDVGALGVNKFDSMVISGNASYNGTYEILNLSYSSQNNQTTVTVDEILTPSESLSNTSAAFVIDDSKSLERDLNHIRTQIKILSNLEGNWFDTPINKPVYVHKTSTEVAKEAGTAIDVGFNFDAGSPFDLSVYLNGQLLTPSTISGGVVTTQNDYQECDSQGNLANPGTIGRTIKINFALYLGDILQMIWNK